MIARLALPPCAAFGLRTCSSRCAWIFGSTATIALALVAATAHARLWTDDSGKYSIEAELIAYDDDSVILQREDHHLGEIPLDRLSEQDRQYLKSKEAEEASQKIVSATQTWTTRRGLKVEGRVVDYFDRPVTLHRRRGKLYVNDRRYDNLPEIYQVIVNRVVEHFDDVEIAQRTDLNRWVARQKGKPRTFDVQGVVMELPSGDEYATPFFVFSEEDLSVLQPGWEAWSQAQNDYESQADAAMRLQALAAARMRNEQVDRQVAQLQLAMQAVAAGVTSLWEVTLYPARGTAGSPIWAVYPGRNSAAAVNAALAKNPGYVAGPVRKVSY